MKQITPITICCVLLCVVFGLGLWENLCADPIDIPSSSERLLKPEHVEEKNWSWIDVFSYLPNAIENCSDLFKDDKELPMEFKESFEAYKAHVKSQAGNEVLEGFSAQYLEELMIYIKSVQAPFVRTVCETGFNAGHSTFTWLASNVRTRVYSFDIGRHNYSRLMADRLEKMFPGRLKVTWGDSRDTLPTFKEMNPEVKCDLMSIDGGHSYDVCKSDYEVFKLMANPDNIVILDNYPDSRGGFMKSLGNVWEQGKQNGEIIEIFKCHYTGQGFSVGRIVTAPDNCHSA